MHFTHHTQPTKFSLTNICKWQSTFRIFAFVSYKKYQVIPKLKKWSYRTWNLTLTSISSHHMTSKSHITNTMLLMQMKLLHPVWNGARTSVKYELGVFLLMLQYWVGCERHTFNSSLTFLFSIVFRIDNQVKTSTMEKTEATRWWVS